MKGDNLRKETKEAERLARLQRDRTIATYLARGESAGENCFTPATIL